jgi:hypothetical protein
MKTPAQTALATLARRAAAKAKTPAVPAAPRPTASLGYELSTANMLLAHFGGRRERKVA